MESLIFWVIKSYLSSKIKYKIYCKLIKSIVRTKIVRESREATKPVILDFIEDYY